MPNLTPLVRTQFLRRASRTQHWNTTSAHVQLDTLKYLIRTAADTDFGRLFYLSRLKPYHGPKLYTAFAGHVPITDYEGLRPTIMRMIRGEKNVLWPGRCRWYAQSSGTSGGDAKFIPVTDQSLRLNHYAGAADAVAAYILSNPQSHIFSGKALILGGSFTSALPPDQTPRAVHIGDLSATLIRRMPPLASHFRCPDPHTALLPDWNQKLPLIAAAAARAPITSLSGVPSWFLILLRRIMADTGVHNLHTLWPGLEVFFHGGISFAPYRSQYTTFTDPAKMHFREIYNASEGFFAIQDTPEATDLLMLIDRGIFFEFAPLHPDGTIGNPLPAWETTPGTTYALIITAPNGLWRYNIGDTVTVTSTSPLRIKIAGRTQAYINAFGEELMQHNADTSIAQACQATGAQIANYTAAPLYADSSRQRGCHQWLIEWTTPPTSIPDFAARLDLALQTLNADYRAKRTGNIFLDPPQIITSPPGTFDAWLHTRGDGRLGGQRKIPRLCPDRHIIESIIPLIP